MAFQPTLPARGATEEQYATTSYVDISTHAPRTGSDGNSYFQIPEYANFNPRSPHGERPSSPLLRRRSTNFNPRSPHGERRKQPRPDHRLWRISTHAPRTGSDASARTGDRFAPHFNPRSPHGERLAIATGQKVTVAISTHAPRTGSDRESVT